MPPHLEKTAKDLLWRMLTVDPEKRAKVGREDFFFITFYALISNRLFFLLLFFLNLQISEIKQHPWFLSDGGPVSSKSSGFDANSVTPFNSDEPLDPEVVQTLAGLWGDEQAVLGDLMADDHNLTKVFFRLSLRVFPNSFFLSFFFFFF